MNRFIRTVGVILIAVLGSGQAQTLQNGAFTAASGNAAAAKSVTSTFTDGTTLTLTAAGNGSASFFDGSTSSPINSQTLADIGNPRSSFYNPAIATTSPAVKYTVQAGTCAPSASGQTCNRGTLTVSFSRSVTDPVLHISGIGGFASGTGYDNRTQTIFTVTTAGITLQSAGTPNNLSVSSTQATSSQLLSGSDCQALNNNRGATAACGSVILKGTFTSVTFNIQIRSTTAVTSNTTTLSDDTTTLAFSIAPQLAANLTCAANIYSLTSNGTSTNQYSIVKPVSSTGGTAGTAVATFNLPSGPSDLGSASLGVSPTGAFLYSATVDRSTDVLRTYRVSDGSFTTASIPGVTSADRILRMAVTSSGDGYMMSTTNKLWRFTTTSVGVTTVDAAVTANLIDPAGASTNLTPAVSFGTGNGDFFADNQGNLYMIWSPSGGGNYVDLFKIRTDSADRGKSYFLGRITDVDFNNSAYGGIAALNGRIYAAASNGTFVSIDLINMQADPITATTATSDLASCYYPTLAPQISAYKTATVVAKGTGNTGANPQVGDTLEYKIVMRNSGTLNAVATKFYDAIPTGTTYVAGSTAMNFAAVSDASGSVMPFAVTGGALIKSPNRAARTTADGTVYVDTSASTTTTAATDEDDNEVVITFRVKIGPGVTSVSNQGVVTYLDGPTSGEITDDPGTATLDDATVTSVPVADLTITKTALSSIVQPSIQADTTVTPNVPQLLRSISYAVTVTNSGAGSTAGTVTVTDTLPGGLSVTAISAPGWSCSAVTATPLTCTRADVLEPGSSYSVITVTAQSPFNTTLETNASLRDFNNTAAVSGGGQTNTANDTAVANVKVAYVKLSKQVRNLTTGSAFGTTSSGTPGQALEYCITFVNYGGVALNNFKVTDYVPGNVVAVTTGYDALEPSTATGFGLQLTRNGAVGYVTSAADTDAGRLATAGGTYGSGVLELTLPTALALNESSGVCFTATIR